MLKKFVKKYFYYFTYFYRYLRYRLLAAFALSMLVAFFDGLGLTLFLPLLQMLDGGESSGEGLGYLAFVITGLEGMGISITIVSVLLVMVVFFCLKGLVKFWEGAYRTSLRRYYVKRLRYLTVNNLGRYSYKSFVLSDSGRIQNTVSGEMERVVNGFVNYLNFLQAAAMVGVYVVLALSVNAQFTALVVLGGVLTNFIYTSIYGKTKHQSKLLTGNNHAFQGLLIQKVAFFKYLLATGSMDRFGDRLKSLITKIENSHRKIGLLNSFINAIREPMIIVIVVGVILIEIQVLGGNLGAIILSLMFFYRALSYLMSGQSFWNALMNYHGSMDNLTEFLRDLEKGREQQGNSQFQCFTEKMEFQQVSFGYWDKPILKEISLELPKNTTLALVGESGSGKTSLMNLMAGLALPDSGRLLIDGVDMAELDRRSFQRRIGYITQEPVIFNDTVFNNVTFWDVDSAANRERCKQAMQKAAVWNFVETLPQKEDSPLGTNGIMVSGGQKQRISIARELYKEVDFLLMDEATSALDSETEQIIQENIDALRGQYTIVIIAHRLSTVRNVDQILVLKEGEIVQKGNFAELISSSSVFQRMVEMQEF
ncbi:ABC transporter ATP-binding protein [Pleomorphovibrio marinus]|uniref:ABC transporter ATP-binding protein n=1 Tax=Pleomorphovibrio marinus TaxID=2164132 RepID=UPI000E0C624E|nr:ABC transporter ATP-binding protein [Pleomorphovibrio marinus]